MKCALVFSCLLVVAYGLPPEIEEKIREMFTLLGEECKNEIGASDDDIAPIKADQPPTTQNGKCFLSCMHKKLGFQDESGKIDKDGAYSQIKKLKNIDPTLYGKLKQVADVCFAEVADAADPCETAFNMFVCCKRESGVAGIKRMDF